MATTNYQVAPEELEALIASGDFSEFDPAVIDPIAHSTFDDEWSHYDRSFLDRQLGLTTVRPKHVNY